MLLKGIAAVSAVAAVLICICGGVAFWWLPALFVGAFLVLTLAAFGFLCLLLPIVDNLERALAAAGEEDALKSGVEMVLRQTRDALTKMGVEEIDPQGQPFDAELMNAVMQGTAEEGEPGTVCMVLQKGYKLGERVIRHAMVKVVAG